MNSSPFHIRHKKDNILREGKTRSIKRLLWGIFDSIDVLALFGVYARIIFHFPDPKFFQQLSNKVSVARTNQLPPPKINMTKETHHLEGVFPIEMVFFPMSGGVGSRFIFGAFAGHHNDGAWPSHNARRCHVSRFFLQPKGCVAKRRGWWDTFFDNLSSDTKWGNNANIFLQLYIDETRFGWKIGKGIAHDFLPVPNSCCERVCNLCVGRTATHAPQNLSKGFRYPD